MAQRPSAVRPLAQRPARIAAAFGALAVVSVAVPAGVSFAGTDRVPAAPPAPAAPDGGYGVDPRVPDELAPPPGHVLHAVLKARGVQIYECRSGAWTPREPAASLTGVTVRPVKRVSALHFRGPSWQSDQDGSLLEGDPEGVVRVASEHPGSIQQLRVRAKATSGTGTFAKVTWIQRIDTVGGAAPAGACAGGTASAPYRAVYRFFVAA
ncbi:DUF3455 domain-containing protein [Actinoplanes philippinensis]|uniref:DUF3455 domain-containing protein n=1 Tax=Actinoplanes philippinensis TaxID=35752 RepID=UPI0033C63EA5